MAGRTECNRMVNFKTQSGLHEESLIGKIISVRIQESNRNFLSGEIQAE